MASWRHGYIASVEQAVDVATKKQPVDRFVFAVICKRANMRRVQCRKSSLACNGATPGIVISDNDTKSALPEAGTNQCGFAPARDRYVRCAALRERATMYSTGLNV